MLDDNLCKISSTAALPGLLFLVQIRDRMPKKRDVQGAFAPNKTLPVHKNRREKKGANDCKKRFLYDWPQTLPSCICSFKYSI